MQIRIFRERAPNFATPHHSTGTAGVYAGRASDRFSALPRPWPTQLDRERGILQGFAEVASPLRVGPGQQTILSNSAGHASGGNLTRWFAAVSWSGSDGTRTRDLRRDRPLGRSRPKRAPGRILTTRSCGHERIRGGLLPRHQPGTVREIPVARRKVPAIPTRAPPSTSTAAAPQRSSTGAGSGIGPTRLTTSASGTPA